jgi:bacteriorhodopsin
MYSLYILHQNYLKKKELFMKRLKLFVLATMTLLILPGTANANTDLLPADDLVGISFWIISMSMLAVTAFFFFERGSVVSNWRTTLTVAGIVTGVAFINYLYVRNVYVSQGEAPILYRYIEWIITMPLQAVQFYLILKTVRKVPKSLFWKLLIGAVVMVLGAYLGELEYIPNMAGFIIGIGGWIYILYEIFSGEAGRAVVKSGNKPMVTAYNSMRKIVTIGWAVYPLGYIFGYLTGGVDPNSLNIIYNIADFFNKIAFGLVIWVAAMQNTAPRIR